MPRSPFKIPLQSEVATYMNEKKGWPVDFCDYYAEKFWNHYQASGWKLSNGNAIKDWKAAFNSQWQNLKFQEDINKLNSLTPKTEARAPMIINGSADNKLAELDEFTLLYKKNFEKIHFSEFGKFYDYMKENGLILKLSKADVEAIKKRNKDDNYLCRCEVVQKSLNGYVNNMMLPSDIMKMRKQLKPG